LQRQSWKRQSRIDLFRKRYDEGTEFLNDLSILIGNRFYYLKRLFLAIGGDEEGLKQAETEYFKVVADWYSTMWMNRKKIRLLIGEAQANLFLDYQDDWRRVNPKSVHYEFFNAHHAVLDAKAKRMRAQKTQEEVDEVNHLCSNFLERLTTDFLKRAAALQLLDVPQQQDMSRELDADRYGHGNRPPDS
jgi:hypothetical protein